MTTPSQIAVPASITALMTGVIDYAGLFPPAALPLDDSIRNYAQYRTEPQAWMLGRFICPAARLQELLPWVARLFADGEPLAVSALGRSAQESDDFIANLRLDLQAIADFNDAAAGRAKVDVFELRLPEPAADLSAQVADQLVKRCGVAGLRPFCEVSLQPDWRESLPAAVAGLARHEGLGFKLRTGGVEAAAFPSTEQVAFAIATCREARMPMKFTAGLHHPVRHHNDAVGTKMHGFLNVYIACVLAWSRSADEATLRAVLEEEESCAFTLRDYGLAWHQTAVPVEEITRARREFAISFGSCSFDEPRDDLRALGLL